MLGLKEVQRLVLELDDDYFQQWWQWYFKFVIISVGIPIWNAITLGNTETAHQVTFEEITPTEE